MRRELFIIGLVDPMLSPTCCARLITYSNIVHKYRQEENKFRIKRLRKKLVITSLQIVEFVNRVLILIWRGLLMKKILLFMALMGIGFLGGAIMPSVWAEGDATKDEQYCNCGCGPAETQVMIVPTGSDMLLMTNLIEAISNDSDSTLSKEELVVILNEIQKDYAVKAEQMSVRGASIELSESEKDITVNSYDETINRLLTGNVLSTSEESIRIQQEGDTVEKTTKNNNGLGNGSEPADGTSSDIKGTDPSNNGRAQSASESKKVTSNNTKNKDKKIKNNNGLGNGSEPADGTSTDVKGIDPSNPGKGSSNNKAGE